MNQGIFAVLTVLSLLVSACSSSNTARQMARVTLAQTVSYEKQVDAKIAAERQYYEKSLSKLQKTAEDEPGLSESVDLDSLGLLYQARFTDKHRAELVTDNDLRTFAEATINTVLARRTGFARQLASYKEQSFLSLGELTYQQDSLKQVKKGLEALQAEPSDTDRLKKWYDFIKETKDKYDAAAAHSSNK